MMTKQEFWGGLGIWALTMAFCYGALGADGTPIDSQPIQAVQTIKIVPIQPVTKHYKLVPVTLEDGTPAMAIKAKSWREKAVEKAERTASAAHKQVKKHPAICWGLKTGGKVSLWGLQTVAGLKRSKSFNVYSSTAYAIFTLVTNGEGKYMPKKVLIALPPAMLEQVDYIAQCEHRTRSDLIRESLRRYLDNFRSKRGATLTVSNIGDPIQQPGGVMLT